MTGWLQITRGDAPLIVCFPHGGTAIPEDIEALLASPWLARKDADWHIADLYAFVRDRGATTIGTAVSRSVIDCNRDPSGASLYPGQATTGLCPVETFDGEPLYPDEPPDEAEIARRREFWFDPYHAAIRAEIARLRAAHERIVLYDAHSIRSRIPRLFEGELPQFNVGTNGGTTCTPELRDAVAGICADSGMSHVVDGRFRGGWTTRHHGAPASGIHAIQMELAIRGYLEEPASPSPEDWPAPLAPKPAVLPALHRVIDACLDFAKGTP
ncbi:N-formylglutamate deformylase [Novosphingobium endophyticum]|uniref:N-formylglutamate deformylase n=1 Tax=Novosphingobium endophyticum TaxID=1955250 RepID=A0A916TQZ8_9SPHN|nr:N-formylglutamate deformylase [Novosphingobium endophyticum]GGB95722.1 N-formylglutamate deformylase [Novosphingobium endophyticum]